MSDYMFPCSTRCAQTQLELTALGRPTCLSSWAFCAELTGQGGPTCSLELGLSVLGVLNRVESQLELTALGWPTCSLEMGLSVLGTTIPDYTWVSSFEADSVSLCLVGRRAPKRQRFEQS